MLARTSAHKYEVEACFELKGENTSAGLVAYYDENYHLDLVLIISRCFVIGVDK